MIRLIEDTHGRGLPVQNLRTYGENKTIDRFKHAESHGAHEKVTASKKRRVIAKTQKINLYLITSQPG